MATLTRSKPVQTRTSHLTLEGNVPAPFPEEAVRGQRAEEELLVDLAAEDLDLDAVLAEQHAQTGTQGSQISETDERVLVRMTNALTPMQSSSSSNLCRAKSFHHWHMFSNPV